MNPELQRETRRKHMEYKRNKDKPKKKWKRPEWFVEGFEYILGGAVVLVVIFAVLMIAYRLDTGL